MWHRLIGGIAVLLPVLVLGYQVLQFEKSIGQGALMRIPIEGLDPRDLLRGHYVEFRYQWPLSDDEIEECNDNLTECWICLSGERDLEIAQVYFDRAPEQCTTAARASGTDVTVFDDQRFYLDESLARYLDRELRRAGDQPIQIEAAITPDGQLIARSVFVRGTQFNGLGD